MFLKHILLKNGRMTLFGRKRALSCLAPLALHIERFLGNLASHSLSREKVMLMNKGLHVEISELKAEIVRAGTELIEKSSILTDRIEIIEKNFIKSIFK